MRFLVLAGEVGGRWNQTTLDLVRSLAWARAETLAPPRLRRATAEALVARWWSLVAVATQDSLAATLLGDAPHLLHGHPPELPLPLGDLLLDGGEAFNRRRAGSRSAEGCGDALIARRGERGRGCVSACMCVCV